MSLVFAIKKLVYKMRHTFIIKTYVFLVVPHHGVVLGVLGHPGGLKSL